MNKLILLLCCCALISCQGSGNRKTGHNAQDCTTVAFQHQDITAVNRFIEEMRILPLESNGEHLIGGVDNLLFTKDRIIVADVRLSKSVHIFDSNGKFITMINRLGPGPEEYTDFSYATLTPDKEKIAIHDNNTKKVLFFDLEGNFLEKKEVDFWFIGFEYIDEDHIVCVTYGANDLGLKQAGADGNLVIFTDGDFNIQTSTLRNIYSKNSNIPIVPTLKKMNDEVFLTPAFSDTIYRVSPGMLNPYYFVDLSAIGGIAHLDAETSFEEYKAITDHSMMFSGRFLENDSFAMFLLTENKRIKERILDKRTHEIFSCTMVHEVNNKERLGWFDSDLLSSRYTFDNQFVAVIPAYQILMGYPNFAEKYPQLTGLTDNSNPVLVFTKLKSPDKSNN